MNDKIYLNELLDHYGKLLTDKQKEICMYYYREDYSLQEIADIEKTSRSAVYDVIRRCRRDLLDYESKLHLHMSYVKRRKLYEEIRKQAPETGSLLDQCIDTETD